MQQRLFLSALIFLVLSYWLCGCSFLQPAPKPEPERVAAGVSIEATSVGGMTLTEMRQTVERLAAEQATPARSARFSDDDGGILPARPGQVWDVAATVRMIAQAPPDSAVSPVFVTLAPAITENMLRQARKVGAYRTPIIDDSQERIENLRLTAKLINNTIVEPGEECSFNRLTGEPTAERGFKAAPILKDGTKVMGLGGGMCQVSSTLYNAVLDANLKVTERHPHSQPVAYVPQGRDATTFTDKDFRFVNNSRRPLIIRSFLKEGAVVVDLWHYSPKE